MIRWLLNWCAGYRRIVLSREERVSGLNCLQSGSFIHWNMETDTEENLTFFLLEKDAQRFRKECLSWDIHPQIGPPQGILRYSKLWKGRWGIPAGILLFFCMVYISSSVVWSIEIRGNRKLSESEIKDMLTESGFCEGVRFSEMDFDLFQNDFLLDHPEVAWIAVNMLGTKAYVEIREASETAAEKRSDSANIVAAEDGQILEVHVAGGHAQVIPLQTVRKGELLISGIMSIDEGQLRFERASGKVLAQVNRTIHAEVSFYQQEKEYTGRENAIKNIIFFGKTIKLFQNGGFEVGTYDTIIETVPCRLPGGIQVPIYWQTELEKEYVFREITLSEEQALFLAQQKLDEAIAQLLQTAEILKLETETEMDTTSCRITGNAVCISDIAETREFETDTSVSDK